MMGLRELRAANAPRRTRRRATITIALTPAVHEALEQLRASGYFGNGADLTSVADELLRWALREHREFLR